MHRAMTSAAFVLSLVSCGPGGTAPAGPRDAGTPDPGAQDPGGQDPGDGEEDRARPPLPAFLERGEVVPPDSIPCVDPDTGGESWDCNHHGSSVAVAADGTVMVVWYHGKAEKSKDSRLLWSRRPPGDGFGPAEVLFDAPDLAEGNPALWVHEDGTLYLFFVTILGESWNDAEIRLLRSTDGGTSWGPPQVLRAEWGWMVRNHPLRLGSGELLLPVYDETTYTPAFLRSADDFASSWAEVSFTGDPGAFVEHLAMIQPSVIERDDGTLFALCRNTSSSHSQAMEMTSPDRGLSWTPGVRSVVPNDSNGIEMIRLSGGPVALAFSNTLHGRYPLGLALSDDGGLSWSAVADVDGPCPDGESCSHGYASIAEDPTDGSLWVTYTADRRTIGWVHTSEAWIRAQGGAFAGEEL
ncbi:MAG: exo-alpha-sialidase [Deltaproteobacteria bacterium]|nr:exo-alpha-sialidase [Deltaproteobacteria bacterium]